MRTAEVVISMILELPPEERRKVSDFVMSEMDECQEEHYSEEDIERLDQIQAEAEKGINVIGPFSGADEAIAYLDNIH